MQVVCLGFCWWLIFLFFCGVVAALLLQCWGVYPEPCTWERKPLYWITSQSKLEAVGHVRKPPLHWRVPLLFLQDGECTLWRKASFRLLVPTYHPHKPHTVPGPQVNPHFYRWHIVWPSKLLTRRPQGPHGKADNPFHKSDIKAKWDHVQKGLWKPVKGCRKTALLKMFSVQRDR